MSIFEESPNSIKYRKSKKKIQDQEDGDKVFMITVKEVIEKKENGQIISKPSNNNPMYPTTPKNKEESKDMQIKAYLGEDNYKTQLAFKARTSNFFIKVVEECRMLSRTIHHLYLHLGSNYRKVSYFLQLMIHDISTDPILIKQILLGDQNLAVDITFLTPQYLFDSLFLGTG